MFPKGKAVFIYNLFHFFCPAEGSKKEENARFSCGQTLKFLLLNEYGFYFPR